MSRIHMDAFGAEQGPEIVALVHGLLEDETAKPVLSLVAEMEGRLVGHILFTGAKLYSEGKEKEVSVRLLAPLGVSRNVQGIGIGGSLIKEGLKQLAEQGVDLVFVLGLGFNLRVSLALKPPTQFRQSTPMLGWFRS